MNVLVMVSYIHIYVFYIKYVLTSDFMQSASPDPIHLRVGLGGATLTLYIRTHMSIFKKAGEYFKKCSKYVSSFYYFS